MSEPRRYSELELGNMKEEPSGDYVLWEAYEKLRAENTSLRAWKESAMAVDALWESMRAFAMRNGAQLGRPLAVECIRIVGEMEAELATLRAKMAGMVCGTCYGKGTVRALVMGDTWTVPCPVCQPAKEVKP